MNKAIPTLLLSAIVAIFVIAIHQTMVLGMVHAYWIFMLAIGLLFLYKLIKPKKDTTD